MDWIGYADDNKIYFKLNMNNAPLQDTFITEPLKVDDGKIFFIQEDAQSSYESFDNIKTFFKQFDSFYYFLIYFISPVYYSLRKINKYLNSINGVKINLGSGNQKLNKNTFNLDFIPYKNVQIVADIHQLPFKENSIDCFVNIAVLEHVKKPSVVVEEMIRCLKPGGVIISVVPFMQPFHASPHDYQRYTINGLQELHKPLKVVETGVFSGPFSSLLWVLQETLASTLSFGFKPLRNLLYLVFMLLTFPIKFLDIIFNRLPTSENVASNFYIVAKK
jgi:SAM-dependent methyltransferase